MGVTVVAVATVDAPPQPVMVRIASARNAARVIVAEAGMENGHGATWGAERRGLCGEYDRRAWREVRLR